MSIEQIETVSYSVATVVKDVWLWTNTTLSSLNRVHKLTTDAKTLCVMFFDAKKSIHTMILAEVQLQSEIYRKPCDPSRESSGGDAPPGFRSRIWAKCAVFLPIGTFRNVSEIPDIDSVSRCQFWTKSAVFLPILFKRWTKFGRAPSPLGLKAFLQFT